MFFMQSVGMKRSFMATTPMSVLLETIDATKFAALPPEDLEHQHHEMQEGF